MLDNFEAGPMKEVAGRLKSRHPHVLLEGSGGLTETNIAEYFSPSELLFRSLKLDPDLTLLL